MIKSPKTTRAGERKCGNRRLCILHYLEGTREHEQVERAHTRLQQDIHALGGTTWLESDLAKSGYGETLLQELRDICAKPTEAMAKWVSTDEAEAAMAFYKPTAPYTHHSIMGNLFRDYMAPPEKLAAHVKSLYKHT